jgi:polysaccharide biosynthesis transport protein
MSNLPSMPPSDPGYPMTGPMEDFGAPPAKKFQWEKFLTALRRFWWIPVITLTLGVGAAVATFFILPPIFISTARMWETEKMRLPDGAAFTEDPQNYVGTQSALLRSDRLRWLALKRLELSGTNSIPKEANGEPLEVGIRVMPAPKSSVFAVEATSANPAFTPAYLDALMAEYLELKKTVRKVVSGGTLASISEQVLKLDRDLKADQDALTAFQQTNNLGVLDQEGSIAGAYLARLKTQLSDYELEEKLLEATAIEQESRLPAAGSSSDATTNANAVAAADRGRPTASGIEGLNAQKEIELLQLQREKLSQTLRPKHPKMVKLDADLARSQKLIDFYRQQNREQMTAARQALKIKVASVEGLIKEWERKLVAANARIASAERLKQNVARDQNLYDRLVSLLNNVDISRNIDQDTLTVLEPASPAKRSYQQAKTVLGFSVIAGMAIGLGVVFLIGMRDDRFTSVVEVTEKIGDAVVGQVPELPEIKNGAPLALLESNDERHIYAESYRNLRSALLFLNSEGERPKVILVTSAVPNEGKSTIATNLARSLALGGSRVLLVDGDLRKGHLHELLHLQSHPGLAELLQQPGDFHPFIQTNSLANFHFLSRGSIKANPGDLILNSNFDDVMRQLRQEFDYVIIDSSPVFAADDSTTLAPKTDGILFVVRRGFSRAQAVREAMALLTQRQARVLGLVLNRANTASRDYYYYKYTDYYREAHGVAKG